MSSSATYDTLVAFLEGDSGDVRTTINGEQASLLPLKSVNVARGPRSAAPRLGNAPAASVEIVPKGPWRQIEVVGIGSELLEFVFELDCSVRRKDLPKGKNQLNVVEDMARALVRRYRDVSNLAITVPGTTLNTKFIRSTAELVTLDEAPESNERARAVVRVSFVFMEDQADNT